MYVYIRLPRMTPAPIGSEWNQRPFSNYIWISVCSTGPVILRLPPPSLSCTQTLVGLRHTPSVHRPCRHTVAHLATPAAIAQTKNVNADAAVPSLHSVRSRLTRPQSRSLHTGE